MKLKEAIEKCEDEWIYVGSKTGFVWIGRKEEFEKQIGRVSIEWYTRITVDYISSVKYRIGYANNDLKKYKKLSESGLAYASDCRREEKKLMGLKKRLEKLIKYSNEFVEFGNRDVIDTYKRDVFGPFGTVFIVPGIEAGLWGLDEFQKVASNEKSSK